MNYGYLPTSGGEYFALEPSDEKDRCFIGLYHQSLAGIELSEKRVLEVGAGRGGGCSYIARYFRPTEVVGLDYAQAAVHLATKFHTNVPNLTFLQGDAEELPFEDESFDVVVNIESSHCYPSMERFISDATRVLKPGGLFTWADMRARAMLDATNDAFAAQNLTLVRDADITINVLAALDEMHESKTAEIQRFTLLQSLLREFAGTKGSLLYKGLGSGDVVYVSRTYRKASSDAMQN